MKPMLRIVVLAGAVIGMGVTMPSCPGQQAMQQQIDQLQTGMAEVRGKTNRHDNEIKAMQSDFGKLTQALPQMIQTIQAQDTSIKNLDAALKDTQAKLEKLMAGKGGARKKGR